MSKKAILFDVDGTLLDTYDFVFDAVKHAVTLYQHPHPSSAQIKEAMGKPLHEFYGVLVPGVDPVPFVNAHKQFQLENMHLVKLFPNTKEALDIIKKADFLLGAVSNRRKQSLHDSLKLMGILNYFDVVVSAEDVANPKPHQEHLLTALEKLEVKPEDAYMVGDTYEDMMAGKNAKVKTIGVTYGFLGPEIKDCNPNYVINNIGELFKTLKYANI